MRAIAASIIALTAALPAAAQPANTSPADVIRASEAARIKPDVLRIVDFKVTAGGFGTVGKFDFVFANDGAAAVKDAQVTCDFFAQSGTRIASSTRTVYVSFPAKARRVVRDFNFGRLPAQAAKSDCHVRDYTP